MTREQLIARFHNASEAFLKANAAANEYRAGRDAVQPNTENSAAALPTAHKEPTQGQPLECSTSGEDPCWYGTCNRFGIRFVVYAVRPADWDGWHVKELQDLLIEAGLIPDDSWKHIEEGSIATRKVHKASEERTEITITPL